MAASAPSYHGLPLTMAHRSKRIILLLDASFGFGVTLVFNEVIDFLRQLGVASNSSEDRSHEYAVMSFASTTLACEPTIVESLFTNSYSTFYQWLQTVANNPFPQRVTHSGHLSTALFHALDKFERAPPSPAPYEKYLLMLCNSPPEDWSLSPSPPPTMPGGAGGSSPAAPHSTAAAIELCRERSVGLSIWSTRDLRQLDEMCRQAGPDISPPFFHQIPRLASPRVGTALPDRPVIFCRVAVPPFWCGELHWKSSNNNGTFICRLAARAPPKFAFASLTLLHWPSHILIDNGSHGSHAKIPRTTWQALLADRKDQLFYLAPLDTKTVYYSNLAGTLKSQDPKLQSYLQSKLCSDPALFIYIFCPENSPYIRAFLSNTIISQTIPPHHPPPHSSLPSVSHGYQ